MAVARSRSTVDQTSSGSKRSERDWTITVPPACQIVKAAQCAAPCMKGGVGSERTFPPRRARSTSDARLDSTRGGSSAAPAVAFAQR
jgi:hypothetical protein